MKKTMKSTVVRILLAVIACTLFLSAALAGSSTEGGYVPSNDSGLSSSLNSLPPFKFAKHKNGIGCGSCPVYSAPSKDSYRCANGKASCQTNSKMDEAGFVNGWLLVRYETNNGDMRVGYIPPKYVKGFRSSMAPHFGYVPAVADEVINVTDNPMSHNGSFAQLDEGESFAVISKYTYHQKQGLAWWYIECTVDGQTARGFIEMDSNFHLGND